MLTAAAPPRAQEQSVPLVRLHHVGFAYAQRPPALQDISLTVPAGCVTMVLGRSGSGKTTLLRIVAQLLRPAQGRVQWAFSTTTPLPKVAYIPQNLGLVRRRTALQNTLVGALGRTAGLRALLDWFPKQTVAEARLLLAEVGLDHKRAEPVACLSGGERQRVAIARALLMRPQLILADEFVSQLDAVTAQQILELMRRQADSGVGFLVTTHDPELVAKYADQVMVLRAGRVVYNAAADEAPPAALLKLLET